MINELESTVLWMAVYQPQNGKQRSIRNTILENRIECSTLWSFNIARENGPFIDGKKI